MRLNQPVKPGTAATGTAGVITGTNVVVAGRNAVDTVEGVLLVTVLNVDTVVVVVDGKQPGLFGPPQVDSEFDAETTPELNCAEPDADSDDAADDTDELSEACVAKAGVADSARAAAASAAIRNGERIKESPCGEFARASVTEQPFLR